MINKAKKKFKIGFIGAISCMITISIISLMGCNSTKMPNGYAENKEVSDEKTSENNTEIDNEESSKVEAVGIEKTSNNKDNKEIVAPTIEKQNNSVKVMNKENKSVSESKPSNGKNNFIEYIGLLGLTKEKLISTLNENPNSIDEGGLEFKKAGIRIWFDEKNNTQVGQIFIMSGDINLNGVKIGDKISRFKEVFGAPISDKNGDAHFKYNGIFLSVNYDTNSQQVYGVYILKNDF